MNASLSRKINGLYKTQSLCERLLDAYRTLKAKYNDEVQELLPTLTEDESNFTDVKANKSIGSTGTVDYVVGFGTALARIGDEDIADQEWLDTVRANNPKYVRNKLELNKTAIWEDIKSGEVKPAAIKRMGIESVSTMKLTLRQSLNDTTVDELIGMVEEAIDD